MRLQGVREWGKWFFLFFIFLLSAPTLAQATATSSPCLDDETDAGLRSPPPPRGRGVGVLFTRVVSAVEYPPPSLGHLL